MGQGGPRAELLGRIRESVSEAVPRGRIGVAFSGGVDSSLLARVCHTMGYDVELLTVGFEGSHDLEVASRMAPLLGLPHRVLHLDPSSFAADAARVRGIVGTGDPSWNENSLAFDAIARLASSLGVGTVAAANGIDELFCGYDAYRRCLESGDGDIGSLMDAKIRNELAMMAAVGRVTSLRGASLVQPLLSGRFIKYARKIPLHEKILGPGDLYRKHVVRGAAADAGVPMESCVMRKKALQYGTGIHKALVRLRKHP